MRPSAGCSATRSELRLLERRQADAAPNTLASTVINQGTNGGGTAAVQFANANGNAAPYDPPGISIMLAARFAMIQ